jgi:hypothetical protein
LLLFFRMPFSGLGSVDDTNDGWADDDDDATADADIWDRCYRF